MKGALPSVAMVVIHIAQVALMFAGKIAIATGMHNLSFIFYSNATRALFLLPAAFLLHRPPNRPAPTFSIAGGFLGLGILGFLMRVVWYTGITYDSATVATAILNLKIKAVGLELRLLNP